MRLAKFDLQEININDLPANCLITDDNFTFGLSKWVPPKRTRSYPYERVYNTLGSSKRITRYTDYQRRRTERRQGLYSMGYCLRLMEFIGPFVVDFCVLSKCREEHPARENKITNQKI